MDNFFTIIWKMSVVLGLFYFFYKMILHKETYFKQIRYFFLLGSVLSIVIPFIVIPIATIQEVIASSTSYSSTNSFSTTKDISSTNIDWIGSFTYIYLLISSFFVLRFLLQLSAIFNLIFKSKIDKQNGYNIIKTEKDTSPFSFFNFIVYNPIHFNETELAQILVHEKVHVKEGHSFDSIVINLILAIQWFNPLVWFYKKEMEQNLEFIADENAVKKSINKKSYQQLLLKTSVPNYQIALANNFYNSLLKKRIIMLQQQRSNSSSQWKFTMIIPLLIAFIFAFNVKTIAQQKKVKVIEEKVDIFALILDKTSSKEYLTAITAKFEDKGLNIKFENIKRNNGNITSIRIDAKAKNGKASASYTTDKDKGISPIQISYDSENNHLNIGSISSGDMHSYFTSGNGNKTIIVQQGNSKDENTWVSKKETNTIHLQVNSSDEDEDTEEIIIEDKNGKKVKKEIITIKKTIDAEENEFTFITDSEKPLFILDGIEITKKQMEDLDRNSIESINVLKGMAAELKYGKKGKHGVVLITSKKK